MHNLLTQYNSFVVAASGSAFRFNKGLDLSCGTVPDLCISYMNDERINDNTFEWLELKTLDGVLKLIDMGYDYCKIEDEKGTFSKLPRLAKNE